MAIIKYEKVTFRTSGELPAVGSRAPDVSLVNTKLQNVSLANFTGRRKLMNIFVSVEREACAKGVIEFDKLGDGLDDVVMLMISYDLPFTHDRFGKQHELKHSIGLSAIRHAGFGDNYGVQIVDGPLAGMFARAIVVLDENNTVVHQEHIEDINEQPDFNAAMRALGVDMHKD